jgi:hypothetical protein
MHERVRPAPSVIPAPAAALQARICHHALATGFSRGYLVSAGIRALILIIALVMMRIRPGPPRPSASTHGLAPVRGRCQQAQGTGARDGLTTPVGTELGVQVAQVGLDGVERDVQLGGDLRP